MPLVTLTEPRERVEEATVPIPEPEGTAGVPDGHPTPPRVHPSEHAEEQMARVEEHTVPISEIQGVVGIHNNNPDLHQVLPSENAESEAQAHPALLKVNPSHLKEVFFHELAENCGAKWEKIGRSIHLGIDKSYLDQLRQDFPPGIEGNTKTCAFRILNKWLKMMGGTEGALQNLYQALLKAGEGQAARFLVQNVCKYLK